MQQFFPGLFFICICTGIFGQDARLENNNLTTPHAAEFRSDPSLRAPGLHNITFLDARLDNDKVGFTPVENVLTKRSYRVLGLKVNNDPLTWLEENIGAGKDIQGAANNRQLILVMRKFWFSNSASERYTVSKPKLMTTLYYQFDMYTSLDIGFYPQTSFAGSFTTLFNNGDAYSELADSLLLAIKEKILANNYKAKETGNNWLSVADFTEHYNQRLKNTVHPAALPKGVYATYDDLLAKKPISDSVEMLVTYNDFMTDTFACQLTAYRQGQPSSCYKSWGYYDGHSLFLNTGSGFYIKLIRDRDEFVFVNLRDINKQRIKPYLLPGIQIGNSSYEVLKDYTRVFDLTYKLDYDTGKLY